MWKAALATVFVCILCATAPAYADRPAIGVFYFPGWGASKKWGNPWDKIVPYMDRKPLKGWYDGDSDVVLKSQIEIIAEYGIDYVVFDWYWDGKATFLSRPLENYLALSDKDRLGVKFAIMWANHDRSPQSLGDFDAMVSHWLSNYLSNDFYLRREERPVVFVFDMGGLDAKARALGFTACSLIGRAQDSAKLHGFNEIYFVGNEPGRYLECTNANFSYNYHGLERDSHSYKELVKAYSDIWNKVREISKVPYFVPVTAGWDKRPWGGSRDPEHDKSYGNPREFEGHLRQAQAFLNRNSIVDRDLLVCCWNEYGEGSYIEPTYGFGTSYLDAIKKVFPR